jgi:hypothetical protein
VIVLCMIVVNPIVFKATKWIPVRHPKTGEQVRVNLWTVLCLPQQFYFDAKVHSNFKRVAKLFQLSTRFALLYVQIPTSFLVTFTSLLHTLIGTRFLLGCSLTAASSFKLF